MTDHLAQEAKSLLHLPDVERIAHIKEDSIWIHYPVADRIFKIITNMLNVKKADSAPCLVVHGAGGSGKSSIIKQLQRNPALGYSIIYIDMRDDLDSYSLKERLSVALGLPWDITAKKNRHPVGHEILEIIRLRGIRALVIDEYHDALIKTVTDRKSNLSLLKNLTEKYNLSVMLFGTSAVTEALIEKPEYARRFHAFGIPPWEMNEKFQSFLAGYEEFLPLKYPSALYSEACVEYFIANTDGNTGPILRLIKDAAAHAIADGVEKIDILRLEKARVHAWEY